MQSGAAYEAEGAVKRHRSTRGRMGPALCWQLFYFFSLTTPVLALEGTWEYAVQVSATVQASPARITLSWAQDVIVDPPANYTVYRKAETGTNWGVGTVLPGTATGYVDNAVTNGFAYEYQVDRKVVF